MFCKGSISYYNVYHKYYYMIGQKWYGDYLTEKSLYRRLEISYRTREETEGC